TAIGRMNRQLEDARSAAAPVQVFQHGLKLDENAAVTENSVEPEVVNDRVPAAFQSHAAPDADVGQRIDPIPTVLESRFSQPTATFPMTMVRIRNLAAGGRRIGREFAARSHANDEFVAASAELAADIERRRDESVFRFADEFAVEKYLGI